MAMPFFEMQDNVEIPHRWFLGSPRDSSGTAVNPEIFRLTQTIRIPEPLTIWIRRQGAPLDITFADFDMPVVTSRVLAILRDIAPRSFESIEIFVEGQNEQHQVLNLLEVRYCLDESRSEFVKWTPSDHRSDLSGQYRMITKYRIDPTLAEGVDIFRLGGFKIKIIVSEKIQKAFVSEKISGVRFLQVG